MRPVVVGIDAGGTSIRVRFTDAETGKSVGDPLTFGTVASGEPPTGMILPPYPVASVCAGITKFTRPGIPDAWREFLLGEFPNAQVSVVPDFVIAFHSAIPTGNGVVIVAGTGSVAYGENITTNESARCGGRGWEWGDEGSGAWLTTEMVRRTLRALDGQAEATPLTVGVCAELATTEPAMLSVEARRLASEDGGPGRGFLLPLLVRLLQGGDAEANGLFVGAGGWLASLATATARRLLFREKEPVTFGAAGGVWKAGGDNLGQAFVTALNRRYPTATVLFDTPAPVEGAVRLASKSLWKNEANAHGGGLT